MAKIYRTAMGRQIDIDDLMLKNETVIAVGNRKVNARGDELGPGGKVVKTRDQIMKEYYALNTPVAVDPIPQPTAPVRHPIQQKAPIQRPVVPTTPVDEPISVSPGSGLEADDLGEAETVAAPIIPVVAEPVIEDKSEVKPAMRGPLANSVAAGATVTQTLKPSPSQSRKANGPQRF